jgi:hypothetical protein
LDQLAKQRWATWSGLASRARLPSRSHKVIVGEMFVEQRQIAPAVSIAVFELLANLSDRLALPPSRWKPSSSAEGPECSDTTHAHAG